MALLPGQRAGALLWTGNMVSGLSTHHINVTLIIWPLPRFMTLHPEKLPSAIERYQREIKRVLGVMEGHLEGRQWLVGDKVTYADLAWVPYTLVAELFLGRPDRPLLEDYPNVGAWYGRLTSRPSWKKVMETRSQLLDPASNYHVGAYEPNS